jgi:hypothetical protein
MTKKEIRNKPVKAITSFFPTDEVKNSDHFISNKRGEQFAAKIVSADQTMTKTLKSRKLLVNIKKPHYESLAFCSASIFLNK